MTVWNAVLLGLVQGIAEFLPISGSGHLAIVNNLLRRSVEWLSWIDTIAPSRRAGSAYSRRQWMQTLQQALVVAAQYNRTNIYQQYIPQYEHYQQ